MASELDKVLAVLQRFISPVNARSLLLRALHQQGLHPDDLGRENVAKPGRET